MVNLVAGGPKGLAGFDVARKAAKAAEDVLDRNRLGEDERKRLEDGDEAARSVGQAIDNVIRGRKSAAAEKVERLKRELELLKLFRSADPKATAREAARIARELSSAAREYGAVVGAAPAPTPTPEPPPPPATPPEGAAPPPAKPQPAEAAAAGATTTTTLVMVETSVEVSLTIRTGSSPDQDFAQSVRDLAAQLRKLMDELRRRTLQSDKEVEEYAGVLGQALAAVEGLLTGELAFEPLTV